MPPVVRPEQVINALEKDGFNFVKQRGIDIIFYL